MSSAAPRDTTRATTRRPGALLRSGVERARQAPVRPAAGAGADDARPLPLPARRARGRRPCPGSGARRGRGARHDGVHVLAGVVPRRARHRRSATWMPRRRASSTRSRSAARSATRAGRASACAASASWPPRAATSRARSTSWSTPRSCAAGYRTRISGSRPTRWTRSARSPWSIGAEAAAALDRRARGDHGPARHPRAAPARHDLPGAARRARRARRRPLAGRPDRQSGARRAHGSRRAPAPPRPSNR